MKLRILAALATLMSIALTAYAQESYQPIALTPRASIFSAPAPPPPSVPTLTVPAETEAAITMLSGLHTRMNQVDDPVTARLRNGVYVNGQMALPPGSLLMGRVTRVQLAGHLHRPAELGLRFERITLPSGETEPISAVLSALEKPGLAKARLDSEGILKGTRGFSLKEFAGGIAGFEAFGISKVAGVGSLAVKTVLPAGGAALIAYAALWGRGNDVNVPPQTQFLVRLNYPVTVKVAW
jgi:hypothetical protein